MLNNLIKKIISKYHKPFEDLENIKHLIAQKKFTDAYTAVNIYIDIYGPLMEATFLKARITRRLGKLDESLILFKSLEKTSEYKFESYWGQSMIYTKTKKIKDAKNKYTQIVELANKMPLIKESKGYLEKELEEENNKLKLEVLEKDIKESKKYGKMEEYINLYNSINTKMDDVFTTFMYVNNNPIVFHAPFIVHLVKSLHSKGKSSLFYPLLNDLIHNDDILNLLMESTSQGSVLETNRRKIILDEISSYKLDCASFNALIFSYALMVNTGNFDIAYAFRKLAIKVKYNEFERGDHSYETVMTILRISIEDKDDKYYREALNLLIEKHHIGETLIKSITLNHTLFNGKIDDLSDQYLRKDEEYNNYINDKKIALVIPTDVEKFEGEEIDQSDIILRLNYTSDNQGGNPIHKGSRTDISYYNKTTIDAKVKKECDGMLPESLKFNCNIKNSRPFNRLNFLFIGGHNMLLNSLLDLLLFNPSVVKIYHADVQIKPGRVKNYYAKGSVYEGNDTFSMAMRVSFLGHDPFGQLNLIKKIVLLNKRVLADEILQNVLDMSTEEYARQITENYTV